MRKMKIFVVICAVFFSLLNVNKSDGKELKSSPSHVLNVIVILDTSDRVSKKKHPDQMKRDIEIVEEIVTQFEEVVEVIFLNLTSLSMKIILLLLSQISRQYLQFHGQLRINSQLRIRETIKALEVSVII